MAQAAAAATRERRLETVAPAPVATPALWAVVLAGGDGARLRPLTRVVCGDERPKQYAPLVDSRSMLRLTLDRMRLAVPPERTLVVTRQSQAAYMSDEVEQSGPPWVLTQPVDRGTAAAILLAAHWIQGRDPDAMMVVVPSDHFVADETVFAKHVRDVANFVAEQPTRCVLLGARPSAPDTAYGWIAPGVPLGFVAGQPIYRVREFWEKPSPYVARTALVSGGLWNTFILATTPSALLWAGRRYLPRLAGPLATVATTFGTADERTALRRVYRAVPRADFSRTVLSAAPAFLAVSQMPSVGWSDWGTPERVLQSLIAAGIAPSWLRAALVEQGRVEPVRAALARALS